MWMQHNMSLASVLILRDIFRGASEYDLKTYPPQLVRSIVLQVFQKKNYQIKGASESVCKPM